MQKRDISGSLVGTVAKLSPVFYNQPRTDTESSLFATENHDSEEQYGETGNIERIK